MTSIKKTQRKTHAYDDNCNSSLNAFHVLVLPCYTVLHCDKTFDLSVFVLESEHF